MSRPRTPAFLYWHRSAAFIVTVLFVSLALMGTAQGAGELDMSFGYGGKVITDFSNKIDVAYDMAVQPDGKIVVVGVTAYINSNNTYDTNFALARYNSDGSLDTSFGTGGKVSTDFRSTDDTAYSVAFQADGKIVVVGLSLRVAGYSPSADFAIARYNSDGTLDSTFGNGGKVTTDFITTEDVAKAVVIQADNKIVVGGYANILHPFGWDMDFALVRYNSDGSLDTTFDGDGKLTTDIIGQFAHSSDDITALALDSNGRIVAGGSYTASTTGFALARYNLNGSLDTTFDTDGKVANETFGSNAGGKLRALVIQPDGKILAAGFTGYNSTSSRVFGLARYDTDGSLDTTFGGDGSVVTPPRGGDEVATDMALTAGGKIVVAGYSSVGGFTVARYLSNGSLDHVFGSRGRLFTYMSLGSAPAFAAAIQADGRILVAGQSNESLEYSDFAIVRYKANPTSFPARSDFDGDGKSDISVFRPSDGGWYVLNSSDGEMRGQHFGTSGDIAVPGDYDGDGGSTDFAVFRPSNGAWYILNSSDNTFRAELFGANGDVPVPADYDGDAKTDIAVFRPSEGNWYIHRSSDNGYQAQPFGISTDRPIPGYYDGDEKTDIAVYRKSEGKWYILQSSTNTLIVYTWGTTNDLPVPADYDGDGRFEIAVFRPGEGRWYIWHTSNGQVLYISWGTAGDKPVPGDYNGDFKTEIAFWRPSDGKWYLLYVPGIEFGASGDTPVPSAYLP